MRELGLGPNGGIMFCLEYLLENIDWLTEKLEKLQGMYRDEKYTSVSGRVYLYALDHYILFDFPGQVELFTHHNAVKQILEKLEKLNYRVSLQVNMIYDLLILRACSS